MYLSSWAGVLLAGGMLLAGCSAGADVEAETIETAAVPPVSPAESASPTSAPPPDIAGFVADFEAATPGDQESFCNTVYQVGYAAAARDLTDSGGYAPGEANRALKEVCPERAIITVQCDASSGKWSRSFDIDRNSPDFSPAWAEDFPRNVYCVAVGTDGNELLITAPTNDTEQQIQANYGDKDISGYEIPVAYEICTEHGTAWSRNEWPVSREQFVEVENALSICPRHPDAKRWKQRMKGEDEAVTERQQGTRFDDGLYRVGDEVQPGTYVATDVEDCYWERQDAAGATIENYFGTALRVQVTIAPSDYGFLTEGCGEWQRSQ